MAQPPQQNDQEARPSDNSIVWAACAPVSKEHIRLAGVQLEEDCTLVRWRHGHVMTSDAPLPFVRAWLEKKPSALETVARIEDVRNRRRGKERPCTHDEMAARARAALLLGRDRDFKRLYHEYTQEDPGGWHPDRNRHFFWAHVLGSKYSGAEYVPEGEALEDLRLQLANTYAFDALPPESDVGLPSNVEWLEVAYALRRGDQGTLDRLDSEGSRAARAAAGMLRGDFEFAFKEFSSIFGRSEEDKLTVVHNHGLPLIIYAIICGLMAGAEPRYMRAWVRAARFAISHVTLALSNKRDMMYFMDNLELVDSLAYRKGTLSTRLKFWGKLSKLPFAMVYPALPGSVRKLLCADELASAVEVNAANRVLLPACYGASGLLGAADLSPEKEQRLKALLAAHNFSLPTLPRPITERVCDALADAVQQYERQVGDTALQQSGADSPLVVASRVETGVMLTLEMDEGESLQRLLPAQRCFAKLASRGRVLLEGATAAELTRLFVALQPQVDIAGSLALPDEELQAPRPKAVLLCAHAGDGHFCVSLRLRLLPGSGSLFTPGCGLDVPVLEGADGEARAVQRDMAKEWKVVEQAVRRLKKGGIAWAEELLHAPHAFRGFAAFGELLRVCRSIKLACCWAAGKGLRLHHPAGGLSLRCSNTSGGWLEVGGGLPVDEGQVLELSSLLEAYAGREGDTLCLGDGEYLLLNPALERQLALLELVLQEKGGRKAVASAAIPLLDALEKTATPGESPLAPAPLPEGLQATLRPYQLAGYRWLAERAEMGLGSLLADDMGLGKTVQVLALLLHMAEQGENGPALVVAPVSLLGNWAEEAARFAPALRVQVFDSRQPRELATVGNSSLVLASYGQVVSRQKEFAARDWAVIVLDEAQAIKNPDSKRARALCALSARVRLCLTGTPIENSLLDLWSQMRFLNPGLLGSRTAFRKHFSSSRTDALVLLRQVLSPLVLRRTKAEVLTQLPPLTEMVEWVEFSKEERALYESLRRRAVEKVGQGGDGVGILAELMRLRRACCHGRLVLEAFSGSSSKLAAMVERVEELRMAGRRVLIFSQFTDVLDLAQEALQQSGFHLLRLDGSTPAAQRSEAVRRFQNGEADAFLISLKAGGAGLNLTAADYVILLDPWWNPAVEAQAAGRSHRMGQQQPVTLCRFMVRDTVEERILDLHRDKRELAESVLYGSAEGLPLSKLRALLD